MYIHFINRWFRYLKLFSSFMDSFRVKIVYTRLISLFDFFQESWLKNVKITWFWRFLNCEKTWFFRHNLKLPPKHACTPSFVIFYRGLSLLRALRPGKKFRLLSKLPCDFCIFSPRIQPVINGGHFLPDAGLFFVWGGLGFRYWWFYSKLMCKFIF